MERPRPLPDEEGIAPSHASGKAFDTESESSERKRHLKRE